MDITQLQKAGLGVYFRPKDLAPFGISHRRLMGLVAEGLVDSLGNGLYRLSEVEATEVETIAMVAAGHTERRYVPADRTSLSMKSVHSRLTRSGSLWTEKPANPLGRRPGYV